MPTGHHSVANALIRSLENRIPNLNNIKVDFFSYANKRLEKAFRLTYLTWIDHSPHTFVWLYKSFVYPTKSTKHFNWYESKFLDKMNTLLNEEKPDLIICTQAFPSFLIGRLRYSGIPTPPVINVYTDFFINKLWGINEIDYHFVPDKNIKAKLLNNYNLNPECVIATGIPIDDCFQARPFKRPTPPYHILISGGNAGLGDLEVLIKDLSDVPDYYFSILCGHNNKLLKDVLALKLNNVQPLSFISLRESMNALYNDADAIITKPGGVTISEALNKKLPIFVHSTLPGQEVINRDYLASKKLIYKLNQANPLIEQLDNFFNNETELELWKQRVDSYLNQQECPAWQKILAICIKNSTYCHGTNYKYYVPSKKSHLKR